MNDVPVPVAEYFADRLAESGAEAQAAFLKRFVRVVTVLCRGNRDSQLCHIGEELDYGTVMALLELCEFQKVHAEGSKAEIERLSRERSLHYEREQALQREAGESRES